MSKNENIIQTKGIGKTYGGERVLHDLNLEVPENSIFGFLGPNGAGKTTTMRILLGFIKATEGTGTIFGKDIYKDSIEIRSKIGYLSQEPRFYDELSARENLIVTARFFFKNDKQAINRRVDEVIDLTGLKAVADRRIKGFSGGERQRLGIAQAQINYPELLILDEPTAALDPLGRKNVLDVMETLKDVTTIFYSTHILSDVQRVSDTVAILKDGSCLTQGRIDQLLTKKNTVYTVGFRGRPGIRSKALDSLPWVSHVRYAQDSMEIHVTDSRQAENSLLKILINEPETVITSFGQKKNELEETFIDIIAEGVK